MKAVWYDSLGPARTVLRHGEQPTPEAGAGEVRVKLHASGINPADVKRRTGSHGMEYPYVIPHSDGAGIVDQVGDGVSTDRLLRNGAPSTTARRLWCRVPHQADWRAQC